MRSLHGRLLIAASLVLVGFLGATGAALFKAFRDSAETAFRERLQGYVYALLAAADEDGGGRMQLPQELPDPHFSNLDSGYYAQVMGEEGNFRWRSPSLAGEDRDFLRPQAPGQRQFHQQSAGHETLSVINLGISWEDFQGQDQEYTLAVAISTTALSREVEGFRTALWEWLGGLALMLLLAQGAILRWGLQPLRGVCDDLRRIEEGVANRLEGRYPQELEGLTSGLNALITSSQASQQRYRNSLGDLAHSLKTPLAILRQTADEGRDPDLLRITVEEQVRRMDEIVQHQLRRAAAAGQVALGRSLDVAPLVEKLARSLDKVYREKAMAVDLVLQGDARFFGDQADLLEILGNLMDNAYKYGTRRVRVTSERLADGPRPGLVLRVEDDGPGVPPDQVHQVAQRGWRFDQSLPGQGLGLSLVGEIVAVYGGQMGVGVSELGGAAFWVRFPPG